MAFELTGATTAPTVTNLRGLGANVATFLATPSTTNLNAALTAGKVPVIIASSGTASSTTSSTSEVNLVVVTIPANTMGANGLILINAVYKFVGTAGTRSPRIRFSGTSGDTSGGAIVAGNAGGVNAAVLAVKASDIFIQNANATNAQDVLGDVALTTVNSASALGTGAVDTTATTYVNFNAFVTNAGDSAQLRSYTVTFYPGV